MSNETRRILLVEDEKAIRDAVTAYLERENYWVTAVGDGQDALEEFQKHHFDLVILDLMLPRVPGERVCRVIRDTSDVPIIMLTAKGTELDTISGLDAGADDYLAKPFSMMELISRANALLRRARRSSVPVRGGGLVCGSIVLDPHARKVEVGGNPVDLTFKEFELLKVLMENPGHALSRAQLFEEVWGSEFIGVTRTVDVHMQTLRQKLEQVNPGSSSALETVRGIGYRMRLEDEA